MIDNGKIPEGFILNPDKEFVLKIRNGIWKRKGHCPCIIEVSQDTICPCKDFRENSECHCNLYVKKAE